MMRDAAHVNARHEQARACELAYSRARILSGEDGNIGHSAARTASKSRERLLCRLEHLASSARLHETSEFGAIADHTQREALQVENSVASMVSKCRRMGACLACTLNPCMCSRLPPLPLSHRLHVVTHCKEVLRTTATGKLLLLAHPDATLFVSGLPEHDAELARVCRRPSAVVLYPAENALAPEDLLARAARLEPGADARRAEEWGGADARVPVQGGGDGADDATSEGRCVDNLERSAAAPLDIILLDGTWNQARMMGRSLPGSVPRVAISCAEQRSVFGCLVRKQGKQREEAGRISTVEAYAQLALALGDVPAAGA